MFAAGVVAAIRPHERRSGDSWSLVALAGAVMQNAIFASVVAIQTTLGVADLTGDVAWGLWQVHNALFTLNTASLVIVLVSVSVGGRRAGLLRAWQRTLGLVAASLLVVAGVTTPVSLDGHPIGMLGLVGFLLWIAFIVSVSVRLLRGSDRDVVPTSRAAAVA